MVICLFHFVSAHILPGSLQLLSRQLDLYACYPTVNWGFPITVSLGTAFACLLFGTLVSCIPCFPCLLCLFCFFFVCLFVLVLFGGSRFSGGVILFWRLFCPFCCLYSSFGGVHPLSIFLRKNLWKIKFLRPYIYECKFIPFSSWQVNKL